MKENLIIVGDYNRIDFLYVASVMHEFYNIYFIEYSDNTEIKTDHYKKWGKAIFWTQFSSALQLVEQIGPKMVLFYFIETFSHVALNVTCKYKGIKTYHIEHGIRSYSMLEDNINKIINQQKPRFSKTLGKLKNIRSRIMSRLFFQNTVTRLPLKYSSFLKEFFEIRRVHSVFETFRIINNSLRIADSYISFSPKIFNFHKKSDHLPEDYLVEFIGCPAFDYLAGSSVNYTGGQNILFIDNAFGTEQLFGWNEEIKIQFIDKLISFAKMYNKKIWIKPHPYSNNKIYAAAKGNHGVCIIEEKENFISSVNDSKVIIGFFSTLLMPLMAMEHTVCFSLEMHPAVLGNEPSMFLVETGATKKINDWNQLENAFENLDTVYKEQKIYKKKFIEDWLYKFDGKSTERLRTILLRDETG